MRRGGAKEMGGGVAIVPFGSLILHSRLRKIYTYISRFSAFLFPFLFFFFCGSTRRGIEDGRWELERFGARILRWSVTESQFITIIMKWRLYNSYSSSVSSRPLRFCKPANPGVSLLRALSLDCTHVIGRKQQDTVYPWKNWSIL